MSIRLCLVALLVAAVLPASAAAADRNDDNIPDSWERAHGLSLKKNQANRDQDRDALRNRDEYRARMDPRDGDSDDDGVEDGDEGAGTVVSFDEDTGALKIHVFNGETFTGLVTDATHISCDKEDVEEPEKPEKPPVDDPPEKPPVEEPVKPEPRPGDGEVPVEPDKPEDDEKACSADDLVPGTVVQEAAIVLDDGDAVWKEVELRLPSGAAGG